jgi:hypothetical protein
MILAKLLGTSQEDMKIMIDYDNAILFFKEILKSEDK